MNRRYFDVYMPDWYPVSTDLTTTGITRSQQGILLSEFDGDIHATLYAAHPNSSPTSGAIGFMPQGGMENARLLGNPPATRCITQDELVSNIFLQSYYAQAAPTGRRIDMASLIFYAHYSSAEFPGCVETVNNFMDWFTREKIGQMLTLGTSIQPDDFQVSAPNGIQNFVYFVREYQGDYYVIVMNIARNQYYEPQATVGGFSMTFQKKFFSVQALMPQGASGFSPQLIEVDPAEHILIDNGSFAPVETRIYRLRSRPTLALAGVQKPNAAISATEAISLTHLAAQPLVAIPPPQLVRLANDDVDGSLLTLRLSPNPAQDVAELKFSLPESTQVHLSLIDMLGRVVAEHTADYSAGEHELTMHLKKIPTGTYFCRLRTQYAQMQSTLFIVK